MKRVILLLTTLACLSFGAVADHFSLPFGGYQLEFNLTAGDSNWTEIAIGDFIQLDKIGSQHIGIKKLSHGVIDINLYRYAETQKSELVIDGEIGGYPANLSSRESDTGNQVHSADFWINEFNRIELRTTFKESIAKELLKSLVIR